MAKLRVNVCDRCGAPADDGDWFTNDFGDRCHACPDGVVGGEALVDAGTDRPRLIASVATLPPCPVCGTPCGIVPPDFTVPWLLPGLPPELFAPRVAAIWCERCMIAAGLGADGNVGPWGLLDVPRMHSCDAICRLRYTHLSDRMFDVLRCLGGYQKYHAQDAPRIRGFTQAMLGDWRSVRRKGKAAVPACPCNGQPFVIGGDGVRLTSGPISLLARNSVHLHGLEIDLYFACGSCGRRDYFTWVTDAGAYRLVYMLRARHQVVHGYPVTLSPDTKRPIDDGRLMKCRPQETLPLGREAESRINVISEETVAEPIIERAVTVEDYAKALKEVL